MNRLRRPIISIVICLLVLGAIASAQQRRKQKTPRAIALVEWPAKGKPVVVPIAILIDGRYYDASIYRADPVPMALEGGTVYEVQQSGDALGFATIDGVANSDGSWFGSAKYQTKASLAAAERKREVPAVRPDPEEGPPKLRKGGSKPADQPADHPSEPKASTDNKPQQPTTPPADPASTKSDDPNRPTLHRREEPQPAPTSAPDHPPEPKKGTPTEAKTAPPAPQNTEVEDEDMTGRPRLRRGKPVQVTESAPAPTVARTTTTSSTTRTREAQSAAPVRVLPAISDATVTEPRSFVMPGSETISPKLNSGMADLARAALDKFASTHGGAHVGPLEKVEVRSFDLSLVNQATVVLTATAHLAPTPAPMPARKTVSRTPTSAAPVQPTTPVDPDLTFWVTIVARENYNGDLRQLAAWTTDSKHLDAYPRMELIDAIDADGDGKGELLFRAVNDLGRAFVISRVTADQVVPLYDSGELAH